MGQSLNFLYKWLIEQAARSTKQPFSRNRPPTPASFQICDQGFALPLAVGMGLIMILVGMTMIGRSQNDSITASAQKATTRGLSAAETGITRYQSFINQYRAIATYDRGGWADASNNSIPEICGSSSEADAIEAAAATDWQDISDGQYRLIDYDYTADDPSQPNQAPGTGTLIVEGQVNQTNQAGTAISRLQVTIPVVLQNIDGPERIGLWGTHFTMSGNSEARANVLDSSCGSSAAFPLDHLGYPPFSPSTKGTVTKQVIPFPDLPNNNVYQPPTSNINTINCPVQPNNDDVTYPRINGDNVVTDISTGTTDSPIYTYRVCADNRQSIDLTGNGDVNLGRTGNETIILYLDGNWRVTGNGGIHVYQNPSTEKTTKVIIYVNGNVDITGNGAVNPGNTEQLQIYKYGGDPTDTDPEVRTSGNGDINAFIFAPQGEVNMTGNGSIKGAVWASKFSAYGNGGLVQIEPDIIDFSELEISPPQTNAIRSVASWQRQEVP